ncbi:DUF6498-containing protein, partial [Halapricum sp. CBA1109]|uniref:DUF6498-containing protein n=1 Tax=Halapricum sp. CBA1109 TaxID=2668068 RepID=UPI00351B6691
MPSVSGRALRPSGFAPVLLANLLPLVGVLAFGWNPATLLVVYAAEVLVSFPIAALKALFAAKRPPSDRDGVVSVGDAVLTGKRGSVRPVAWLPPIYPPERPVRGERPRRRRLVRRLRRLPGSGCHRPRGRRLAGRRPEYARARRRTVHRRLARLPPGRPPRDDLSLRRRRDARTADVPARRRAVRPLGTGGLDTASRRVRPRET